MSKKRSKPRTLDSTWKLCLEMWKFVSYVCGLLEDYGIDIPDGFVNELKEGWMEMNGFDPYDIEFNCFFCDWADRKGQTFNYPDIPGGCKMCPGVKVDKKFACQLEGTCWYENPVEFYNWLVALDNKRKSVKGKKNRK